MIRATKETEAGPRYLDLQRNPRMAPIHQPQVIRFAIAMAPRAITRMMAIGVSQEISPRRSQSQR